MCSHYASCDHLCTVKNDTPAGLLQSRLAIASLASGNQIILKNVFFVAMNFLLDMSPSKDYNFSRVIHTISVAGTDQP
jgi:hypothetical protein